MRDSIRIFTGYDQREAVGWHVCVQSIIERTSEPVEIIPLTEAVGRNLKIKSDGTNNFTKLRFAVPYLCGYHGFAIFLDCADMLLRADLAQLWEMRNGWFPVNVVKHDYEPKHKRKYIGTEMEADNASYPKKNWSSMILWDCGNYMNRRLNPEFISEMPGSYLHRFSWLPEDRIGEVPMSWNWLDEYDHNQEANVMHYTNGIPGFRHYKDAPHAEEWNAMLGKMSRGLGG